MKKSRTVRDKRYNATISGRYRGLVGAAKSRSLRLMISRAEYETLIKGGSCFYCEDPIDLSSGSGYLLDRINNSKSYYLNNVVVCCAACNRIKSDALNFEESIFVIRALKEFRKKLK